MKQTLIQKPKSEEIIKIYQINSGGLIEEYIYDADGNRVKKIEYASNTTTYYIDESFIQIRNSSGTYNETYYYDSKDLVAKKDNSGNLLYYHPDHLGSTSLVTNSSGGIVENTFYLPFGEVISGGMTDSSIQERRKTQELVYIIMEQGIMIVIQDTLLREIQLFLMSTTPSN